MELTRSVTPGRARNVLKLCALAGAVLGSSHGYSASTKVWSVNLERPVLQVAARLELLAGTLPVGNVGGDALADQLALQAIEEFVFGARAFQMRLRQQHDRLLGGDLRRRLTHLLDLGSHAPRGAGAQNGGDDHAQGAMT